MDLGCVWSCLLAVPSDVNEVVHDLAYNIKVQLKCESET